MEVLCWIGGSSLFRILKTISFHKAQNSWRSSGRVSCMANPETDLRVAPSESDPTAFGDRE